MSGNADNTTKLYEVPNELPETVSDLLQSLRAGERSGEVTSAETNAYLAALHDEGGWSLRALANAFGGVTFQAVNFRIQNGRESGHKNTHPVVPVPEKPEAEAEATPASTRYAIPTEVSEEMKRLVPMARQYRGTTPKDHPNAVASRRLTELMARERDNGATYKEIGEAAGLTWGAVKFRLGRYGHEQLPPSASDTLLNKLKADDEEIVQS